MPEHDLGSALAELQTRKDEIARLNAELDETNKGVLALYAELDDRAILLESANELKTQMISYLSHEFRTPLNSITALSALLLDSTPAEMNEEQKTQATFIREAALNLLSMVNDLLDGAKIDAGQLEANIEPVSVVEVFAGLRGALRPLVKSDAVELHFADPTALPLLHTDAAKLTQILRNLIANALKFTESGRIDVRATVTGDRMLFVISDTGIGVPPEERERIFQAFAQVDGELQRVAHGTGLGLSLSRKLAGVLGGSLRLADREGAGATFTLELPLNATGRV